MTIKTEPYLDSVERLPESGQHILANQEAESVVVYQAYNNEIANYAVQHQTLGGSHFSYNRMSWIKPNFLWMMFRCGWASKENQERVLAIWIRTNDFESILEQAVFSSFNPVYTSHDLWKTELAQKEVRLQWDPDHDPFGNKLTRRAIQLGMKGSILENFGKKQIQKIEDITPFVKEQKQHVDAKQLNNLIIPFERIYKPVNTDLCKKVAID